MEGSAAQTRDGPPHLHRSSRPRRQRSSHPPSPCAVHGVAVRRRCPPGGPGGPGGPAAKRTSEPATSRTQTALTDGPRLCAASSLPGEPPFAEILQGAFTPWTLRSEQPRHRPLPLSLKRPPVVSCSALSPAPAALMFSLRNISCGGRFAFFGFERRCHGVRIRPPEKVSNVVGRFGAECIHSVELNHRHSQSAAKSCPLTNFSDDGDARRELR